MESKEIIQNKVVNTINAKPNKVIGISLNKTVEGCKVRIKADGLFLPIKERNFDNALQFLVDESNFISFKHKT